MRVTFANCFLGDADPGDLFVTDEVSVAEAAPAGTEVRLGDEGVPFDVAQAANLQLWKLAFDWFRSGGEDPTLVNGLSAGDIAGSEVGLTVLLPAARGALGAAAALNGAAPDSFVTLRAIGGPGNYDRIEQIQCEAAETVAVALAGKRIPCERRLSHDPRNRILFGKYRLSRDPDWLVVPPTRRAALARGVLRFAELASALRSDRRPTLVVLGYNPTRAFIDRYAVRPEREYRLALHRPSLAELRRSLRTGDRVLAPPPALRGTPPASPGEALIGFMTSWEQELSERFRVNGWDLWPVVRPHLQRVLGRFAHYVALAAPRVRRQLERVRADGVLVPFDSPAEARLIVRVAQDLGIPTFVLNNGFVGDDFGPECMTADVGLAWSQSIADNYFSRRPQGRTIVTGNPRGDTPPPAVGRPPRTLRRVLVGSLSYAPPDLNCRRSDPERFLESVLAGIDCSTHACDADLLVKLHPSDSIEQYDEVVSRFPRLAPRLQLEGDVVALFEWCDVYVTTFSTSLIEAAAMRVPILYYRVNEQRLDPPFSGDPWLAARTAAAPGELAALLDALVETGGQTDEEDPAIWSERYLGPRDGQSVTRVIEAIRSETAAPRATTHCYN